MYAITFYSFKGGVGRTMALVNVGLELVRRGRRVLLVDFDLEAPGLTTYETLRNHADHPGVLEYVTEYIRTRQSPDVSRFIYPVDLNAAGSHQHRRNTRKPLTGNGRLWVMPAGKRDSAYGAALAGINWNALYEDRDGYLFFEDTKLQWNESIKPDYVLIDSRTGHTDVGGICTRQLADAVVLLFTPNEQNELGLRDICRAIRAEEKENGRPIKMHLVMSNVPRIDDENGILRRQVRRFLKTLQFPALDGTFDRYESLMHLDQRVFVLDRPRSRLAKQYRSLITHLIIQNSEDREGAIIQLDQMRRQSDQFGLELGVPVRPAEFMRSTEGIGSPKSLIHSSESLFASAEGLEARFSSFGPEEPRVRLQRITDCFSNDQEIIVLAAEIHAKASNYETALALLAQSLRLGDSPEALLLRSRVQFQIGDKDLAIEDLITLIRSGTRKQELILEAIRDLHRIDEQRLLTEVDPRRLCGLSPSSKVRLADLFATPADSFERSVALLQEAVQGIEDDPAGMIRVYQQLPVYLLYRREWGKVIELLQRHRRFFTRRYQALSLFHQALAHWGQGVEMPEHLCQQIALVTHAPSACESYASDCQALALVYWRLGDHERAKSYIQKALRLISRRVGSELSYWRCLQVSPEIFRDDCDQINRLIDGERLKPLIFTVR